MPKLTRSTGHGIITFIGQNTLTIGDQNYPLEITRFNGSDSCLTFFGARQLLEEMDETPNPRDYFKKFRAERYERELSFLAEAIPAYTGEWKEIKRDIFRSFYIQIAVEVSVLFPQTEKFAKRWLERKLQTQQCPHEFEHVWDGYRGWPMPVVGSNDDVIFSTVYFRNRHCLKWLSLREVTCGQTSTDYTFIGHTVMNDDSEIHKEILPLRVESSVTPRRSPRFDRVPLLDLDVDL